MPTIPQNFLQICQRVRSEAGISGSGPATVVAQVGQLERVVNWAAESWLDIQNARSDWRFQWKQQSIALEAGVYQRSPTAISAYVDKIDDARCFLYRQSIGNADAQPIDYEPWEIYSLAHSRWANFPTGRPSVFTFSPDLKLQFPCYLDDDYTMIVEYYQDPQILEADADTTRLPRKYIMAIVWNAVMKYADNEESGARRATAERQYRRIYANMVRTETPPVRLGDPLE